MQKDKSPLEISVQELKEKMDNGEALFLLDVRQPYEHEQANIGGTLIQLDQLPARMAELEGHKEEQFIVYCRSGARSGRAVQYLKALGFSGATNLKGGMIAWSAKIDPTMTVS